MKTITRTLILLPLLATAFSGMSQNHPASASRHVVTIIRPAGTTDSTTIDVYNIFLDNAPKAYLIPGTPRFAIEGKERKFYLGIGGTAKATVSFDWGKPIDNAYNFTTSAIPLSQAKGNGGRYQFSAATSGLYLNFVALPGDKQQIGAYINFNFTGNGNDYGFNLFYAYLKYRGFTVGYDFSLFSDMAAVPPTIDNEGPNALTAIPNGVIDYRHSFNQHWSVGIGAELPMMSATNGAKTANVYQRIPDVPAFVQYSWNQGKCWVRFSGIVRNMLYRDLEADRNRNNCGWGMKMSGSASAGPVITYYQAAYGRGITSYFQDLYGGGLDMVPNGNSRMKTVEAWGGYFGLQYNFSPSVFATAVYSQLRNYAGHYSDGAVAWGEQYKYAQYALANIIWNMTPQISTGIEYIYGRRVDMDGISRHDNRLQSMLRFTF